MIAFLVASPVNRRIQLDREASMKTAVLAALLFTSTLAIGTAAAQPAPYNEIGVTMGLAHHLEGCGSEQEAVPRHGRQAVHARRKPADDVPRHLYQPEPGDR